MLECLLVNRISSYFADKELQDVYRQCPLRYQECRSLTRIYFLRALTSRRRTSSSTLTLALKATTGIFKSDLNTLHCKPIKTVANFSPKSKTTRQSASDLFDSVLLTPVAKLSSKFKKRPSFVDNENPWSPELVKVLGWVIFSLVLVCLIVMFLITFATFKAPLRSHFQNWKAKKLDEIDNLPSPSLLQLPEFTGLQQEFLLDNDVTFEEVMEMKRVLEEDSYVDEEDNLPAPDEKLVDSFEASMKAETSEKSYQVSVNGEQTLEKETKLVQVVFKILEDFVAHSKNLTIDVDKKKDVIRNRRKLMVSKESDLLLEEEIQLEFQLENLGTDTEDADKGSRIE